MQQHEVEPAKLGADSRNLGHSEGGLESEIRHEDPLPCDEHSRHADRRDVREDVVGGDEDLVLDQQEDLPRGLVQVESLRQDQPQPIAAFQERCQQTPRGLPTVVRALQVQGGGLHQGCAEEVQREHGRARDQALGPEVLQQLHGKHHDGPLVVRHRTPRHDVHVGLAHKGEGRDDHGLSCGAKRHIPEHPPHPDQTDRVGRKE
mmetsp:Transcript_59385/g.133835  ORF Transcript_59385/g.133835 Transcript_59385/m.133835 type:complete len:204 (+) Transcript_59385:714-1325(+)